MKIRVDSGSQLRSQMPCVVATSAAKSPPKSAVLQKAESPKLYADLTSLVSLSIAVGALLTFVLIAVSAYLCFWMAKFETEEDDSATVVPMPSRKRAALAGSCRLASRRGLWTRDPGSSCSRASAATAGCSQWHLVASLRG